MKAELFSKHEQQITKQLTAALDQRAIYQAQRKNNDPMSSFGKTAES